MLFLYLFIDLWARVMLVRPTVALANSEVWEYDDAAVNGSGEYGRVTVWESERFKYSERSHVMSCRWKRCYKEERREEEWVKKCC